MTKSLKYGLGLALGLCLVLAIIFLSSMEERGLESYLRQTVGEKGVVIQKIACSMNNKSGRNRIGSCQFPADTALFERFKTAMELQEYKSEPQEYVRLSEGCFAQEWIKNPSYQGILASAKQNIPFRNEVIEYRPLKSLPMMGNITTSFIKAYYNRAENRVCVDLQYPYG